MGDIQLLKSSVVSMIAAGEVVERPASALKEMVENSIDSGAKNIDIMLEDGGITSIRIVDDGKGMSAEDLCMSVQPHATSKLTTLDDLDEIDTLGFRGEALAAISSLSNTTLRSRMQDSENGHELKLQGSWSKEQAKPCVMAHGTEIVVRDMFIHTPARRKFLRKPPTEWAHCEVTLQQLAIGNPEVTFTVGRDGKHRFSWQAQTELERAHEVLGKHFASQSRMFSHDRGQLEVHGYVDLAGAGSRTRQFLYLNGRAIQDRLLRQAVRKSFADSLRGSEHPYVLFLTVPKKMVDVNAHPSKLEVRFKEPNAIFSFVAAAIDKVTQEPMGVNPNIDLEYQSTKKKGGGKDYSVSGKDLADLLSRRQEGSSPITSQGTTTEKPQNIFSVSPEQQESSPASDQLPPDDMGTPIGLLQGIYLLSETDEGLMVIDIHAAHERILYEGLKDKTDVKAQDLVLPIMLDLSPVAMDAVQEHRALLAKAGLRVENDAGVESLLSVPSVLAGKIEDPGKLAVECINELVEFGDTFAAEEMSNKVLSTVACHAAVRGSNPLLDIKSLDALLKKMEVTLRSGKCNHGRPCWRLISFKGTLTVALNVEGESLDRLPRLISDNLPDDLKGSGQALLIAGPTGTGKSEFAVEAADKLDGEVISVDSCAVYRGFDIGSAKPDKTILKRVPHHLIDIRDPDEQYSVGDFFRDASQIVTDILDRGKTPILCGGTMMYVNVLLKGINEIPAVPADIHERTKAFVSEKGGSVAHAALERVDPNSARRLSGSDSQRIIRALEVYEATGKPLGEWISAPSNQVPFSFVSCFLVPSDRKALSHKLRERFTKMIDDGFVDEVRSIVNAYGTQIEPLRSVGYRQVLYHVQGKASLEDTVEKGVIATRRLVKRQMTWIRKFSPSDDELVLV